MVRVNFLTGVSSPRQCPCGIPVEGSASFGRMQCAAPTVVVPGRSAGLVPCPDGRGRINTDEPWKLTAGCGCQVVGSGREKTIGATVILSRRTWPEWYTICAGLQDEKDIVELPDRRLLAMIRSGRETYRSYSSDRGRTWNQGEKLDLFGQCPSLLLLPSGNLLFAYRQVRPGVPTGIGLAVSGDSGLTWHELKPLYLSPTGSRDCAYPSMILSESGEVLCAYYTTFTKGDCHIELARIEVRESPVG